MTDRASLRPPQGAPFEDEGVSLAHLLRPATRRWRLMVAIAVLAGALGTAGSFLMTPVFSSTTTFLPPQQQQSSAASALASLGALAGMAGGAMSVKSPAEQYVALMESVTVSDRIIEQFKLMQVYDAKYHRSARMALSGNVTIKIGKKDGLISVTVDDIDRARAAAIANQYIEELRRLTSVLAVSEAQQRRVFFKNQMNETKADLITAQTALQKSGFNASALKAEPKASAEEYARLQAEWTTAEVRLSTLRSALTENAPEVQRQMATSRALRKQLDMLERSTEAAANQGPDYISKYREFKYQETLFELMSKQYEIARVDESREGALIQVVDAAQPAELKSKPKRTLFALGTALAAILLATFWLIVRERQRQVPAA